MGARMNARFAYGFSALDGGGLLTSFGSLSLAPERAIYAVMLRGMLRF